MQTEKYTDHSKNLPRLNRVIGQLEGIKKMISENKNCIDILFQLKAVRSAIKSLESEILEEHLNNCVLQSFNSQEDKSKKIKELIELFKKFDI